MHIIKYNPLFLGSLALVLIATLTPGDGKIAGNYLDKIVHFLLFAFLAFQALKATTKAQHFPNVIISCILLGLLTEFLQQFIPGRNMDIYDAIADISGVVVAFYYFKVATSNQ